MKYLATAMNLWTQCSSNIKWYFDMKHVGIKLLHCFIIRCYISYYKKLKAKLSWFRSRTFRSSEAKREAQRTWQVRRCLLRGSPEASQQHGPTAQDATGSLLWSYCRCWYKSVEHVAVKHVCSIQSRGSQTICL